VYLIWNKVSSSLLLLPVGLLVEWWWMELTAEVVAN